MLDKLLYVPVKFQLPMLRLDPQGRFQKGTVPILVMSYAGLEATPHSKSTAKVASLSTASIGLSAMPVMITPKDP